MVRKLFFLAILLLSGGLLLSSCKKEEPLSSKKEILSFLFEASKNSSLDQNVVGVVNGTDITVDVPFGSTLSNLTPTIETSPHATVSPASGVATDFTSPVVYTVTAEDGSTKQFTVVVTVDPAPYIGTWNGGPIDFGIGLLHVKLTVTANGEMTMELQELLTQTTSNQSIKGTFNPNGLAGEDLLLNQTHRWIGNNWSEEAKERTVCYCFTNPPKMRFYYALDYPKTEWWFQIDLIKE